MQGILDREKLMERLEISLERAKTQFKLEGKVWQQNGPSDRLRELRERMDGDVDYSEAFAEESGRTTVMDPRSSTRRKPVNDARRMPLGAFPDQAGMPATLSKMISGKGVPAFDYAEDEGCVMSA